MATSAASLNLHRYPHYKENPAASTSGDEAQDKPVIINKIFDFCALFFKTFGITTSLALAVVPSWTLILSTKDMSDFLKVGIIGGLCTTVIQMVWSKFEKDNKQNIDNELSWYHDLQKRHHIKDLSYKPHEIRKSPLSPPTSNSSQEINFSAHCEDLRIQLESAAMSSPVPEEDEFSVHEDVLLTILLDESKFQTYKKECYEQMASKEEKDAYQEINGTNGIFTSIHEAAEEFFAKLPEDRQEKLTVQYMIDCIGSVLADYNERKRNNNKSSVERSEQYIGETKIHSKTFKAMSLAAKVCKEVGNVGKLFNFENLLKSLYTKYHDAISNSKNLVDIWICIAEYSCVYTRRDEMKILNSDIESLLNRREKLEIILATSKNLAPSYTKRLRSSIQALSMTIDTLEMRKKDLELKNRTKITEITLDLFEAALSGSQDLLELLKTKTAFFKDLPKLLDWMIYIDEGMNVFCSLVSFVFNVRKLLVTNDKRLDLILSENYCLKELTSHKSRLDNKEDTYTKFLAIKIDALQTSQQKRLLSLGEKAVKILDDVFSTVKYTQVLLLAFGIPIGTTCLGVVSVGATVFTLCSLGFSLYRFCYYDIYLQRHHILCKFETIRLRFQRSHELKTLKKYAKSLDSSSQKLDELAKQISNQRDAIFQYNEEAFIFLDNEIKKLEKSNSNIDKLNELILMKEQGNIDKIINFSNIDKDYYYQIKASKCENERIQHEMKDEHRDLVKKSGAVAKPFLQSIKDVEQNDINLDNKDSASKLKAHQLKDIEAFRKELEIELQDPLQKALWRQRLCDLGFPTKPINAKVILHIAVSKGLPNALKDKAIAAA